MTTNHIAPASAERNLSIIPEIGLTEIDGEPRARDIEIAERLGYSRPRKIRELIEANLAEIEGFGTAPRRGAPFTSGNGTVQEAEEFWLNEEQALLVAALAKTKNAAAVRAMLIRCFVAWRRGHLLGADGIPAATLEEITRTFGIMRKTIHKVTEMERVVNTLPALVETVNTLMTIAQPPAPGVVIRHGKTAGAILKGAGITGCPTRLALWFGNRLEAAGCRVEGRLDTGTGHARLFDPDRAEAWLKNGGKAAVERKIAERSGQGALSLSGRGQRAASIPAIPPDMDNDGIGAIIVEGAPVYFDIRVKKLEPGARYVVINVKGDVLVDIPECSMAGRGGTMGPRGVLTSPRMEAVPGRHDPIPTQWEGVILGKVIERQNVVRIPVSTR